ncbi:MAG: TetR/AcrR family transcriptional regulator [Prevotellaceae bacterium]|jgi:AcrR family transcriptional regulator|nr:TetR/AcrR family transcriptional regulator [Prevotellaceae bacterium]
MDSENVKERIVKYAAELFAGHGCKSVTMDDIASSMGISKRTIYENFRDKNSLVAACIHYFYEQSRREVEQIIGSDDNVFGTLISFAQTTSQVMLQLRCNFFREIQKYFPDVFATTVQQYREQHVCNAKNILRNGQKEGLFKESIDANSAAVLITTLTNAILTSNMFEEQGYDKRQMAGNLVYSYLCGISTSKGLEVMERLHEIFNLSDMFLLNRASLHGIAERRSSSNQQQNTTQQKS